MADKVGERDEQSKVSVFKRVYTRHKRQGKNPNRIDDLLGDETEDGVIDVARIRKRCCHESETNNKSGGTANDSGTKSVGNDSSEGCCEKDLVTNIESMIFLPDTNNNSGQKQRMCSCFSFREFPGVYLYPGALDRELQLRLAYEAVTEYCELGPTTTTTMTAKTILSNDGLLEDVVGDNHQSNCNYNHNYGSHRTNIDLLPPKAHERVNQLGNETENMWNLWKQEQGGLFLGHTNGSSENRPEKKAKRETKDKSPKTNPKRNTTATLYHRRFSKLSWATMGYHYDWTERSYHREIQSKMPDLVARVSTLFATASPTGGSFKPPSQSQSSGFTPSASIVNYYTTKSTMGGHRDDLEDKDAMDKPIVSLSLGLSGIFVLGGPTKDEYDNEHTIPSSVDNTSDTNPNIAATLYTNNHTKSLVHPVRALLLHPGDVLVMGGASRLYYHAMARVLPHEAGLEYDRRIDKNTTTTNEVSDAGNDPCGANLSLGDILLQHDVEPEHPRPSFSFNHDEKGYLEEYLRHHRVNINVRQVYPDEELIDPMESQTPR